MESNEIRIHFLEKSLDTIHSLRDSYDRKASFLLSVSGIIFALAMVKWPDWPYVILTVFSLVSFICCIYAVVLPYRPKTPESRNIFCWWGGKRTIIQRIFPKNQQ